MGAASAVEGVALTSPDGREWNGAAVRPAATAVARRCALETRRLGHVYALAQILLDA